MATNATSTSSLSVYDLRCEYQSNPLGLDIAQPRLSWKLMSGQRSVMQSAYQVLVKDEEGELWNTGKIPSDQSLHVSYNGPALRSGQRCTWQVRVWDRDDCSSAWSEPACWEMGLLHTSDQNLSLASLIKEFISVYSLWCK
jgi:alpha-L-rhamnosidase